MNSRAIVCVPVCLVLSVAGTQSAIAYWQTNGVAISTAASNQQLPQLVSDGAGGAIITWEDSRNGPSNIYAQRVHASGNVLWTVNGVAICDSDTSQASPEVVSDGAGGAIVTWYDNRWGYPGIYAQRVDGSGNLLWTWSGVPICSSGGGPQLVSDGAGGAIITWPDIRGGTSDIYAQRVDGSGNVLWATNGVAICAASNTQWRPQLVSDGGEGAIITWHDRRGGLDNVYAQRVDASGNVLWTANGVAICTVAQNFHPQYEGPQLVSDGSGGAIITWWDDRTGGNYEVYAQRVTASGSVLWATNGVAICTAANSDYGAQALCAPQLTSDGAGGAIMTWYDLRSDGYDVYAQRVSASGNTLWTANGVAICNLDGVSYPVYGPQLVLDGAGGAIITWHHLRSFSSLYDIYAQRVTGSGNTLWTTNGVAISTAASTQMNPQITSDGAGRFIIAWEDYRSGTNYDVYSHQVSKDGELGDLSAEIFAVRDVPGDQGGKVYLSWRASSLDLMMDDTISRYSIWRSISPIAVSSALAEGAILLDGPGDVEKIKSETAQPFIRVEEVAGITYFWEYVTSQNALFMEAYALPVATLFDSTSVSEEWHYFQVVTHTTDPKVFWTSDVDSGYSVDNFSPGSPQALAGGYTYPPGRLLVTWEPNTETDLSYYAVYKGNHEGFTPGPENLLGTPEDTVFADDSFDPNVSNYYKVSAFDIHENESSYSLLRPEEITGAADSPAVPFLTVLEQNVPNPFNPATVIHYAVARPGWVRLVVYDVTGRPVRVLVQGPKAADRYEVTWDGRDGGGREVASGVYLYVLDALGCEETRKMTLLR